MANLRRVERVGARVEPFHDPPRLHVPMQVDNQAARQGGVGRNGAGDGVRGRERFAGEGIGVPPAGTIGLQLLLVVIGTRRRFVVSGGHAAMGWGDACPARYSFVT